MKCHIALFVAMFMTALSRTTQADVVVGGNRPVTVHVPPSYDPSVPIPVIIALHGWGGTGAWMESYWRIQSLADAWGFLYAYPDGIIDPAGARFWNATDVCCYTSGAKPDDSTYLSSILDEIEAQFTVDRDRICFCGLSNGGFMSYRMACDHAGKVTAIASQAGATFDDPADCVPSVPVHVLEIHGTADDSILYNGGFLNNGRYPGALGSVQRWATYNGCSGTPQDSDEKMDLVADVFGPETRVKRYTDACNPGGLVELWTMAGAGHVPNLVYSTSPASTNLASSMVQWLLSHPRRQAPSSSFTVAPAGGQAPFEIEFDATASSAPEGATIVSWHWDFGDTATGEGILAVHTYARPGRYAATLRVVTADQRVSLATTQPVMVSCAGGEISPWAAADIGGPPFPGNGAMDGDALSICAGGRAIVATTGDEFYFVYQEVTGDFAILLTLPDDVDWEIGGRIGLVARESLDPLSSFAAITIEKYTSQLRQRFRFRDPADLYARPLANTTLPRKLMLARKGDNFLAWTWPVDGRPGEPVHQERIPGLSATLLVGLGACGGDSGDEMKPFVALRARAVLEFTSVPIEFVRGDSNADGEIDIGDPIFTLSYHFAVGRAPTCLDAADANDDGQIDIGDAITMLGYIFANAAPLPAPLGECGIDPTADTLDCLSYPHCVGP